MITFQTTDSQETTKNITDNVVTFFRLTKSDHIKQPSILKKTCKKINRLFSETVKDYF